MGERVCAHLPGWFYGELVTVGVMVFARLRPGGSPPAHGAAERRSVIMLGIMRVHNDRVAQDALTMIEMEADGRTIAGVDPAWVEQLATGTREFWAQVPPSGSDWEAAEWDALAHRAGVA